VLTSETRCNGAVKLRTLWISCSGVLDVANSELKITETKELFELQCCKLVLRSVLEVDYILGRP
jgi:hypothetical protein